MPVRAARRVHDDRGQSLVETALAVPLLLLLLVGAIDAVRAVQAGVILQSATQAGAQYGALSAANAADAAGIEATVRGEASLPQATGGNPTVSSSSATDANGEKLVTVQATYTQTTLFAYPGIPQSYAVTRAATLQVRR